MVEHESRSAKGLKLGAHLAPELLSHASLKEEAYRRADRTAQLAMPIDKIGDLRWCKYWCTVADSDVQTDTQARIAARTNDCILGKG